MLKTAHFNATYVAAAHFIIFKNVMQMSCCGYLNWHILLKRNALCYKVELNEKRECVEHGKEKESSLKGKEENDLHVCLS